MVTTLFDERWQHAKEDALQEGEEIVEHGWEQHVLLDHDNRLVYRYPRNKNAALKLADEVQLLDSLNELSWPVAIPRLREHTSDYSVYELIEGEVLTADRISKINSTDIANIGEQLGLFLANLHQVDKTIVERKETKQKMTLLEYYERRINDGEDSKFYEQARKDLNKLMSGTSGDKVVVHGDLHGLNMVIDPETNLLVGVIDFSEVEIGDPHQDFRKIFMADERLLEPSLSSYENECGRKLSENTVKLWAYVNEWANVCFYHQRPDHPTHQRAFQHLTRWRKI